jgi:hypothetical protein
MMTLANKPLQPTKRRGETLLVWDFGERRSRLSGRAFGG